MAELVKALDSSSNPRMRAWVRIPLDAFSGIGDNTKLFEPGIEPGTFVVLD